MSEPTGIWYYDSFNKKWDFAPAMGELTVEIMLQVSESINRIAIPGNPTGPSINPALVNTR